MLNKREAQLLETFNRRYLRAKKLSFKQTLNIFNSMLSEYLSLKIYEKRAPLEGIEPAVRIAKILNSAKGCEEQRKKKVKRNLIAR